MNNKPITDKNVNFGLAKDIETNEQKRVKSCSTNINRILEQHKCELLPVVEIIGNQVGSKIIIRPKQR